MHTARCTVPRISAPNTPIRFIIPFMHQFSCMNYDHTLYYIQINLTPFSMPKYQPPTTVLSRGFFSAKQNIIFDCSLQDISIHLHNFRMMYGKNRIKSRKNYSLGPKKFKQANISQRKHKTSPNHTTKSPCATVFRFEHCDATSDFVFKWNGFYLPFTQNQIYGKNLLVLNSPFTLCLRFIYFESSVGMTKLFSTFDPSGIISRCILCGGAWDMENWKLLGKRRPLRKMWTHKPKWFINYCQRIILSFMLQFCQFHFSTLCAMASAASYYSLRWIELNETFVQRICMRIKQELIFVAYHWYLQFD